MIRLSFQLITMGHWKQCAERDLFERYQQRLAAYGKLTLREMKSSSKEEDGRDLLKFIPPDHYVIALDESGDMMSSEGFASFLESHSHHTSQMIFIIGGADGLSSAVRKRADKLLSLSSLTWPHMMVRPMLAEQLYRAMTLINKHPYHRS